MNFKKTSRKNDLESLCYLMLYLLNGQDMPGLDQGSYDEVNESMDTYQIFKVIMKLKEK